MPDLRTESAVAKLVEGVEEDLGELGGMIERAKELMDALVEPTRGLNGLAPFLRGQSTLLNEMIENIKGESAAVRKNMLGTNSLPEVEVITGQSLS